MKKVFITLLMAMVSITMMAQIVLVPGKFTTKDGKGFLVKEMDGTQQELYDMVKSNVITLYNSPDNVLSENAPKVMTLNGIASGIVLKMGIAQGYPLIHYKINIYFKDGKIRFDAPIVIGTIRDEHHSQTSYTLTPSKMKRMSGVYPFFKKDGSVRDNAHKKVVEDYFNDLIFILSHNNDKQNDGISEDW